MKILEHPEGKNWLTSFGIKEPHSEAIAAVYENSMRFSIPTDSGIKTCLSRLICELVKSDKEVCLWIAEHGVFPNLENLNLFTGYRKSIGEPRSVDIAPCHIFLKNDLEKLESLLALSLYFFWDVVVFDPAHKTAIYFSHDEALIVYTKDTNWARELAVKLKGFNLELA